jgi:tetratricopeptide (TPR) repeat protein
MITESLDLIRFEGGILNSPFSCLKLTGTDVERFLNGQTVNDVRLLSNVNQILANATVDTAGRAEYLFALALIDQDYYIICRPEDKNKLKERLEKYIITDDVKILEADSVYFVLGLMSNAILQEQKSLLARGFFFNDQVGLIDNEVKTNSELILINEKQFNYLVGLSGFAHWDMDFKPNQLLTNSFASQLINFKKGCFLGQEVLAKIINNRGAAFFPAYLLIDPMADVNEIISLLTEQKIINQVYFNVNYKNQLFLYVSLHRNYRVEGRKIQIADLNAVVKLSPVIKNDGHSKAKELYDEALDQFANSENVEKAVYLLKLAILSDNQFCDAYESLGVILDRLGKTHQAIEIMHELNRINPDIPMTYTNLSLFYMKVGEIKKAEDYKAQATVAQFKSQAKASQDMQKEAEKKQQELNILLERQDMFKQVLEIDEEDIIALNGLGEVNYKLGQFKQARDYLIKAIQVNPKHSVAHLNLAECLIALNELDEAKQILIKGIEVASLQGELMPANKMQSHLNQLNS